MSNVMISVVLVSGATLTWRIAAVTAELRSETDAFDLDYHPFSECYSVDWVDSLQRTMSVSTPRVKIKSCNCGNCNWSKRRRGSEAKAFVKASANRSFRHQTKLAIASQREVPESISGDLWG